MARQDGAASPSFGQAAQGRPALARQGWEIRDKRDGTGARILDFCEVSATVFGRVKHRLLYKSTDDGVYLTETNPCENDNQSFVFGDGLGLTFSGLWEGNLVTVGIHNESSDA